jgi:hypothetical protein
MQVGHKRFPAEEAALIAELIRRDVPYYSASITRQAITGMCAFARSMTLLSNEPRYEDIVATELAPLWD